MIFIGSTKCPICESVLEENHAIVMIPAFIENANSSLFRYTDTGMHQNCFDNWDDRVKMVAEFNNYYKRHYRGMRVMCNDGSIKEVA